MAETVDNCLSVCLSVCAVSVLQWQAFGVFLASVPYIPIPPIPPMPPMPPPIGGAALSSGFSVMTHSAVVSNEATPEASIRLCLITLVGSIIPAATMSTNSPVCALYPAAPAMIFSTMLRPSTPALSAMVFVGMLNIIFFSQICSYELIYELFGLITVKFHLTKNKNIPNRSANDVDADLFIRVFSFDVL